MEAEVARRMERAPVGVAEADFLEPRADRVAPDHRLGAADIVEDMVLGVQRDRRIDVADVHEVAEGDEDLLACAHGDEFFHGAGRAETSLAEFE